MSTVQQAIEVSAPLHTVYEQLATFESYPRFMTGVEQVIQTSSNETHWVMELDGQRREFDAQIIECSPDQRLSWSTMDGPLLAETITLRPMGETRTQIVAQLEADVAFLMPSDRHGQESLSRRLKADLASFKQLIEHPTDDPHSGIGAIPGGAERIPGAAERIPGATSSSLMGGAAQLPSPATIAARAGRRKPAAGMSAADVMGTGGMAAADMTAADMTMNDMTANEMAMTDTQTGGAGMGGQAMSADDAWGDGMVNEEERGSAYDM